MTADDLNRFLADAFGSDRSYIVDEVDDLRLIARRHARSWTTRLGGHGACARTP